MRKIIFNVTKEWFYKYRSGEQLEVYRAITKRWQSRFQYTSYKGIGVHKEFDIVEIRLGYPKTDDLTWASLQFKFEGISIGQAKAGIGRELVGDKDVFIIKMSDL